MKKQGFYYIIVNIFIFTIISFYSCVGQNQSYLDGIDVVPASERTEAYFPLLEDKRIGIVGNHTSKVGDNHLVDTLLNSGFNVIRIFSPEHGFRGIAAAGEHVDDEIDRKTGLPVISLYGNDRRPELKHLKDLDIIVFDIQDVGARFYTYISTMTYVMEETARASIPMLILDRPNPNAHYVDGPVLDPKFASFVGMHEVPVVYGMTVGEYALMVNGEGWLKDNLQADIKVVKIANYSYQTFYKVSNNPSPNLPNMTSIYLYPSLCFFEGTVISVGRGTPKPFQVFGHPELPSDKFEYTFVPESTTAAPNPPHLNKKCFGKDLSKLHLDSLRNKPFIDLNYLIKAYKRFPYKDSFFNSFFDNLAGTDKLRKQITEGYTDEEIRQSWKKDLECFKKVRKKYLLYDNFE